MRDRWKALLPDGWDGGSTHRVHMDAPDVQTTLAKAVYRCGLACLDGSDGAILLCIGTDRSIGDALGPLVGSQLIESGEDRFTILGTLDDPVHASNLVETLEVIYSTYKKPLIIAVDACLGRLESVGTFAVGQGALKPGAGVNKSLPEVGQVSVTGVVNVGGFMEYFVLQNTRLSLVTKMARVLAKSLSLGMGALMHSAEPSAIERIARPD